MKLSRILGAAALTLVMSAQAWADDINIAVVGPMTGQLATIGDQFKHGARSRRRRHQRQRRRDGRQIKLVVEDDVCDPKQAVSVANRIVGNGIKFVDGHACSGSSIPASAVYAESAVLMMSPASSNPQLTDDAAKNGWPTIMRLYTRDDAQGAFIGPWIAEKYKGKNVVILHDKSAYGQGVADAVKETMNAGGLNEVLYEGINAGEKDYSALVTKLKELKADVVYFGGYHPEGGLILRQSAEQNFKFQLIMPDSIARRNSGRSPARLARARCSCSRPIRSRARKPRRRSRRSRQAASCRKASRCSPMRSSRLLPQGIERAGSDDPVRSPRR